MDLARVLSRLRPHEGWGAFLLMVITVLGLPAAAVAAEWVPKDEGLFAVALAALLVGRGLSRRRAWGWTVWLPMGAALGLLISLSVASRGLLFTGSGASRVYDFFERWLLWLRAAATGDRSQEPEVFLFYASLLCWLAVLFAAWALYRQRRPLLALVPSALIAAVSVFYSERGVIWLVSQLGCGVLLVALVHLGQSQDRWEAADVDYSVDLHMSVLTAAVFTAATVSLLSFYGPLLSREQISDWFRRTFREPTARVEDTAERLFGGVATPRAGLPSADESDHGASSYLPQDRLLGGRPDLLDEVVMQVWTDEPAPLPEGFAPMTDFGTHTPPHYWQGLVFDRYTGRGWSASVNERTEVQGNLPLTAPPAYRGVTQRFQLVAPHGTTLYSLSGPVWIEQQVEALWRIAPPMQVSDELTDTPTAAASLAQADLAGLSSPIVTYTVLSHIPEPTASALRRAPAEYPPEVAEIYLQLPETVPMRVIDLAQKVVTEGDSAYEQARLLEAYLRQYPYTLDVEAPPEERDVADYFLFDLREGYCDYYATAFVVMARAVGIPSRLVSGYVGGGFDFNTESYVIRHYNGHSWPEVYFPGWGWVSFEPTGSQPVQVLREEASLPVQAPLPPAGPPARVVRFRWRVAALSTLGLALAVLLATRMSAYVRRRRPALTLPYLWLQLGRAGARVGVQPDPALTPYEYAALLSRELRARAERVSWRRASWQDQARRTSLALARLAMMYSEQTYRGRVAPLRQVALRSAWRRLQVALSRFGWLAAWQRLGDRLTGKAEETS